MMQSKKLPDIVYAFCSSYLGGFTITFVGLLFILYEYKTNPSAFRWESMWDPFNNGWISALGLVILGVVIVFLNLIGVLPS